jgi:hypothetical protein
MWYGSERKPAVLAGDLCRHPALLPCFGVAVGVLSAPRSTCDLLVAQWLVMT